MGEGRSMCGHTIRWEWMRFCGESAARRRFPERESKKVFKKTALSAFDTLGVVHFTPYKTIVLIAVIEVSGNWIG